MYLDNTTILIAVLTPLDMTLAVSLIRLDTAKTSRAAAVVKPALAQMISILKSRNFLVQLIMSDGEGAIGKMRFDLMVIGIEVDVGAAGGHVARIERRIQMVKERARAHICGRLPFSLIKLGNTYLALYCVSRYDPHSCTAVRVPAYVRFGSRTIRAIRFMTCLSLCLSVS